MKVYNDKFNSELHPVLVEKLNKLREARNFDAKEYIKKKTRLINDYMKESNLKTCVVAVSGGIDSAIVLALVSKAREEEGSPIKSILPMLLPDMQSEGVTNQSDTVIRGKELCDSLGVEPFIVNMSPIVETIQDEVEKTLRLKGRAWAHGQLVPYARTPVLYFATSLMAEQSLNAIICGTTNLSEGGYLGYVGKASDGMVDVQLISDIFKSEVYKVAEELNIPQSILNVTPAGDMYDSRDDEDVFGAPYDFVELYTYYLNMEYREQACFVMDMEESGAIEQFDKLAGNLEKLHSYNKHKYLAKSPAVHLDLWPSGVKGGWDNYYDVVAKRLINGEK